MDPPQPQTLLDDLDYMLQAIRVFLQHLIMDPLQPQELVDEVDYMLEAIRVFLQHLIMDLPQPQELLDELDYMLQAMRVFLHQLWMHPLILLFIIYIILGHSYFMCRLDMRLRRTELTDYLDAYWLQLFGAPILFIIISDFIVGVEFDLMHTNDLIEISWGTVVRRAKRGLIEDVDMALGRRDPVNSICHGKETDLFLGERIFKPAALGKSIGLAG